MGKVFSLIKKPIQRINIESRAHKVISLEKPVPAPQRESTKKQLEIAETTNPTFLEVHGKKDAELDERLKQIYVQSYDTEIPEVKPDPNRPLPLLTRSDEPFEYGFWEPEKVPEGKCTLRTALAFMSEHLENPVENSIEAIAKKHSMDAKDVANILQYCKLFRVVLPVKDDLSVDHMDKPFLPPGVKKE